jgi:hypothetical protein
MSIRIRISGVPFTPSWVALQETVSTALGQDGLFTRIKREDGGANYRRHGWYTCTFTPETGDDIDVELEVTHD